MSHVLGKAPVANLVPVWNGATWTHQIPPIISGQSERAVGEGRLRATWRHSPGDTIAFADPVTAMTFDGVNLWCVTRVSPSGPSTLRKLDPNTGASLGTLVLGSDSNLIVSYRGHDYTTGLASSPPGIWVIYTTGNADRVNPDTVTVNHSFVSGDIVSGGAAVAIDSVWVGGTSGTIRRIRNPASSSPTNSGISLTAGASTVDDLVWDGQNIYVAYRTAGGLAGVDCVDPTTNTVIRTTGAGALGSGNRLKVGWDGRYIWSFHSQSSPPSTIRKHDPRTLSTLAPFTVVEPGSSTNIDIPNINYDLVWDGSSLWFPSTSGLNAWAPEGRVIQLLLRAGLGGDLPNPADPLHTSMYQTGYGSRKFAYSVGGGTSIARVSDPRPVESSLVAPIQVLNITTSTLLSDGAGDAVVSVNAIPVSMTVTLPAAPTTGREYLIKDATGTASVSSSITVAGNGNNIDGGASRVIAANYEALRIVFNGTQWSVG